MSDALRAILFLIGASTAVGLVVALVIWLVRLAVRRRRPERYWRRVARMHLWLIPVYVLLVPPLAMASLSRWRMGTRGDERAYAGPRVDEHGAWAFQTRESLREERRANDGAPAPLGRTVETEVRMKTSDGVWVRGFLVPAREPPRFQAVLVHGLFRNALELEHPAAWLHGLGGDVLLLEMRNHGGSGRGRPGFGLREREDVLAAVRYLRSRSVGDELPLLLYGVSLGSAAVLLAAPDVPELGALAVDAALPELEAVFHNLTGDGGFGLPLVHRWLTLRAIELFAWFDVDDVRPVDAAARLDPALPALVVAAGDDFRMPPALVRRVYDALPSPDGVKEFWVDEEATHGKVFELHPDEYRAALERLVERMLSRRR